MTSGLSFFATRWWGIWKWTEGSAGASGVESTLALVGSNRHTDGSAGGLMPPQGAAAAVTGAFVADACAFQAGLF